MAFRQLQIQFFADFPRADSHEGVAGSAGSRDDGRCLAGWRHGGHTGRGRLLLLLSLLLLLLRRLLLLLLRHFIRLLRRQAAIRFSVRFDYPQTKVTTLIFPNEEIK